MEPTKTPYPSRVIRATVAVVVIVVLIVAGYFAIDLVVSLTNPRYRAVATAEVAWPVNPTFQNCWQDQTKRFRGAIAWTQARNGVQTRDTEGTYLPVNGDPVLVLRVDVLKAPLFGDPAMRLSITSLGAVSTRYSGETIIPMEHGNPPIICDLNPAQAAYVQASGVPQELMNAMQAAAHNAGWQPVDSSTPSVDPGSEINVDPKPFFP